MSKRSPFSCFVKRSPSLQWVEYAHNSLPVSWGTSPPPPPVFQKRRKTWRFWPLRSLFVALNGPGRELRPRYFNRDTPTATGRPAQDSLWVKKPAFPPGTFPLAPCFIGPYTITCVLTPSAVHLSLPPPLCCIHPVFHMYRVKPYVVSCLTPLAKPPPPPLLVNGDPIYIVAHLLKIHPRG